LSACCRTASMVETQVTSVTFLGVEGYPRNKASVISRAIAPDQR
jgi:hypothetical protein